MRPLYIKPENALQRAEELLEVNAPLEALNVLQETLSARKSRGAAITSLEPLTIKLIELAVEHRRNRVAREGLHSYKNLAQNTSVGSVEKVVRRFLECSEAKLKEAQDAKEAAEQEVEAKKEVAEIEDLETPDTYESLFASMLNSFEDSDADLVVVPTGKVAERPERDQVTPRLKFLWDAYRTVLDVLRNNARLELLYQQTVAQAFAFCVRYKRKNEFRRLCDTLRMHLSNLPRQANASYSINLSDPDVLQRFLDTRFLQLQTATDMELWQEGFKSAEDIYQLLLQAAALIAPTTGGSQAMIGTIPASLFTHKRHGAKMMQMFAQYYEKMTRIFSVSGDGLFLAAAWNKYFGWIVNMRGTSSLNEEEQKSLAIHALLSALAAPVFADPVDQEASPFRLNRKQRLTAMLGLQRVPDRASLLAEAASKNILARVPGLFKQLYECIESGFHPLTVAARARGLIAQLEEDSEYARYAQPIRDVVVAKVLQQMAKLYSTISFETMVELTSIGPAQAMDMFTLEKVIMKGNKKEEFNIKVNHLTRTFDFVSTKPETPDLLSLLKLPLFSKMGDQEKAIVFQRARSTMEEEHQAILTRQNVIEQKKVRVEQVQQRKAAEEAAERQRRIQDEREALQKKLAEEARQREVDRLKKEQEDIRRQEARKIAEALKAKSGVKIADEDLDEMDTTAIFALQAEQIKKEKESMDNKMKTVAKRLDHMERAIRKEEVPLLEKAYEEQKVQDRKAFEEARKRAIEEAKERHATAVTIKHRVQRMMDDYIPYRDTLVKAHEKRIAREQEETKKKIEQAKEQRREYVREQIRRKIAQKEREEEERARREEEEAELRKRQEEEEERRLAELEAEARLREAAEEEEEQQSKAYRPPGASAQPWGSAGRAPAGAWVPQGRTPPQVGARVGAWAPRGGEGQPGRWVPPRGGEGFGPPAGEGFDRRTPGGGEGFGRRMGMEERAQSHSPQPGRQGDLQGPAQGGAWRPRAGMDGPRGMDSSSRWRRE